MSLVPRMLKRPLQLALVLLGVLGFLVQGLFTNGAAGHNLCIGCDRDGAGGWTLSAPCETGGGPNCCEAEDEEESTEDPTLPSAHGKRDCSCIDVPLVGGTAVMTAAPRVDATNSDVFKAPVVVAIMPAVMTVESRCTAVRPRAGPSSPPRLLTPLSRRTVLVL